MEMLHFFSASTENLYKLLEERLGKASSVTAEPSRIDLSLGITRMSGKQF